VSAKKQLYAAGWGSLEHGPSGSLCQLFVHILRVISVLGRDCTDRRILRIKKSPDFAHQGFGVGTT